MAITALLLLAACAAPSGASRAAVKEPEAAAAPAAPVSESRTGLLGTVVTVTVYGRGAEPGSAAFEAAFAAATEVDEAMSVNRPDSEISRVNESGFGAAVPVSEGTYAILEEALRIAELSGGAFDPAIGGLTELWKEDGAFARLPSAEEIAAARPGAGAGNVELRADGTVRLAFPGTRLDLGAIAKGYACDRAAEALRGQGVSSALLDFGGNVYALGAKPGGEAYTIGIASPYPGDGSVACTVPAMDAAVVTSGGYQKFFEEGGVIYHHILDPATGYPVEGNLLSVSIVAPSSTLADGLSTACFVLGLDRGMALLDSIPEAEGVFITADGTIHVTAGLIGVVSPADDRFTLPQEEGVAVVYYENEPVKTLRLGQDREYVFERDGMENRILVEGGSVRVAEANCANQTCVQMGAHAAAGDMIVCLPHSLVIKIEEGADLGADTVAG
jgi:thiamine biosynthesis lipoprotein